MIDLRNRDLAISATSKIVEKVTNSFNARDTEKRWFWELLQNAKDTVVFKPNEEALFNILDKKVDVKLTFTKNDNNDIILKFEHNGNPFRFSNHLYKYDDPKCLLLADSGKIEEDENDREDVTGQFGTGFLSTHILSLRILVEGIYFDRNKTYSKFNFELDRREFQNKLNLAKSVEKSLNQYDNNFTQISNPTEFKTSFTYFLSDNKVGLEEGIDAVRKGLDGLEEFIPYVLSFSKEIRKIEICDDLITKSNTVFHRDSELKKEDRKENIIKINKDVSTVNNNEEHIEKDIIYISAISDINSNIDLCNRIYKTESGFQFKETDKKQPVLFCTFPLIGSENWRFPLMFNCSKFYPRTERDGITLTKNKDNGNWNKVETAIDVYKKFCLDSIEKGYEQLLFLADTRVVDCPDWCDEETYKSNLNNLRDFLLPLPIVIKESGDPIKLENTLFPSSKGEDNLKSYWDVCFDYCPNKIPQYKDIEVWNKLIDVNYKEWDNLKFPLKRLLSEIEKFETLDALAEEKFASDIAKSVQWLNKVFQIIIDRKRTSYFKEYKIIPTISGILKSFSENDLFVESEMIPDEFIEILNSISQNNWNNILMHRDLIIIDSTRVSKSIKDISDEINRVLNHQVKNNAGQVQESFYNKVNSESTLLQILQISSNFNEDTFRAKLFNSAKQFFGLEMQVVEVHSIYNFDFRPAKRQLIKLLNSKIEDSKNLEGLNIEKPEEWLLSYLLLLQGNSDFKQLLEFGNIVPNRKGVLKAYEYIRSYGKERPLDDTLIDILYDLNNNENWNEKLIHDEFRSVLTKDAKTIEVLASKIQHELEELRKENLYSSKSDAILNLIKWCSNTENDHMLDYFRAFISEKDKIFVNISLDDKDAGDNIVRLLQHKEKLSDLVEIAEISEVIGIDKVKAIALKERDKKENFEFKKKIGKQVEISFIEVINSFNLPFEVIYQGLGDADVIIKNLNNGKEFYIELKSLSPKNINKNLQLSMSQAKKAVERVSEGNYVVSSLVRPINWESVTPQFIKNELNSLLNIGNSLEETIEKEKMFEKLLNFNDEIYLEFEDLDRKVIIPENFWRKNGVPFDDLINCVVKFLA